MTIIRHAIIASAMTAAACSPPSPDTSRTESAGPPAPAQVAALISAAVPDVTITSGELSAGNDQYEVTGTLPNGDEIEIDIVRSDGEWAVQEIQRDVEWSSVPGPVRAAAAAAPGSFEPVRVIESLQTADGSVVYELFRQAAGSGASRGPAMEVRWFEGTAEVIP